MELKVWGRLKRERAEAGSLSRHGQTLQHFVNGTNLYWSEDVFTRAVISGTILDGRVFATMPRVMKLDKTCEE